MSDLNQTEVIEDISVKSSQGENNTNLEVLEILEILEIKTRIVKELQSGGFPNLKFLFSDKALKYAPEVMADLLELEKKDFDILLKMNEDEVGFDDLCPISLLDSYRNILLKHEIFGNKAPQSIWKLPGTTYSSFKNRKKYSKRFYKLHLVCVNNGNISHEQKTILERAIEEFERNGINYTRKKQNILKNLDSRISSWRTKYANNIVDGEKRFTHIFYDDLLIADMPEHQKNIAMQRALEKGVDGYLFDESPNSRRAIFRYCSDRKIREKFLNNSYATVAPGKYNNTYVLLNILDLRDKKAKKLNFSHYNDLAFHESRMDNSPKEIQEVLREISQRAQDVGANRIGELKDFYNIPFIGEHDISYYLTKYQKDKHLLDMEKFDRNFEFNNVLQIMFDIAEILFGISLQVLDTSAYHSDINIYKVSKNDTFISYFVTDYFSRAGKKKGAFSNLLKHDFLGDKTTFNSASFDKAKTGKTYLTVHEIQTMFHEFGHALHNMFSSSSYKQLNGKNCGDDFIEVPSRIFENWARHPEVLHAMASPDTFANTISFQDIEAYCVQNNDQAWKEIIFLTRLALLDLDFHGLNVPRDQKGLRELIAKNYIENSLFPIPKGYTNNINFSHFITGRYSAGFHTYISSEIISQDIWSCFLEEGDILSSTLGEKLKDTLLSPGSLKSGNKLFHDFRLREPNTKYFLESSLPL